MSWCSTIWIHSCMARISKFRRTSRVSLEQRVEFIRGDIRTPADVERALNAVDTVVHLAAAVGVGQSMCEPHYYTSVNVDGQGVIMEAIAKHPKTFRRLVVASSMSIYGEGEYR